MSRPASDSGRALARRVLRRVTSERAFATLALDAELQRAALSDRERRLATEIVYGVCRHLSRLDRALEAASTRGLRKVNTAMLAVLRVAAYQMLFLDRVPDHAAVDDAVGAARRLGGTRMAGFANGMLRRLAREGEPPLPPRAHALEHMEAAFSLPRWIAARLVGQLGEDEAVVAAEALGRPAPLALRVRPQRCTAAALVERLERDHPGCEVEASAVCPDALLVSGLGAPERSPSFQEGLWTVQDVGSQLVGWLVGTPERAAVSDAAAGDAAAGDAAAGDAAAGDAAEESAAGPLRILDACAGLGGKSLHLADRLGPAVILHAADQAAAKLALLEQAAARLGVTTVTPLAMDLTAPTDALLPAYDAVLLDAPCTGLGVLRRHPEAKWRVGEDSVAALAALQRALLDAVAPRVRPGGVLIYSVCTFTDEEGPAQLQAFLERHPDFALDAPGADGAAPDWAALAAGAGVLRTWPHRHGADAFFAARLRRR